MSKHSEIKRIVSWQFNSVTNLKQEAYNDSLEMIATQIYQLFGESDKGGRMMLRRISEEKIREAKKTIYDKYGINATLEVSTSDETIAQAQRDFSQKEHDAIVRGMIEEIEKYDGSYIDERFWLCGFWQVFKKKVLG